MSTLFTCEFSTLFTSVIRLLQSLRDVTLFLNSPLPDPCASLSIFFALPPFAEFRFIGSVNNASPSTSVRLRLQPGDGQPTALQLVVLMEPTAASEQRSAQLQARAVVYQYSFAIDSRAAQGNEFSQFGRCVAMDLMRYCQSFQIMAQGGGDVLSQLLSKWSLRFEEKSARDPYWWMKAVAE